MSSPWKVMGRARRLQWHTRPVPSGRIEGREQRPLRKSAREGCTAWRSKFALKCVRTLTLLVKAALDAEQPRADARRPLGNAHFRQVHVGQDVARLVIAWSAPRFEAGAERS